MLWCNQSAQKKSQRTEMISLDMAVNSKQKGHIFIPGQRICHQCIKQYEKIMKEPDEIVIHENETKIEEELQTEEDGVEYKEFPRKKLNTSL